MKRDLLNEIMNVLTKICKHILIRSESRVLFLSGSEYISIFCWITSPTPSKTPLVTTLVTHKYLAPNNTFFTFTNRTDIFSLAIQINKILSRLGTQYIKLDDLVIFVHIYYFFKEVSFTRKLTRFKC